MSQKKKIVIVGGVAGGASTAARARRLSEDAEIIMFERGEYISFANCGLPYHIGGMIEERDRLLVQTPEKMNARFKIDVRVKTEVIKIDTQKKQVTYENIETGEKGTESYDNLVLSPGADAFKPPLKGIDSNNVFSLRNMKDMDRIKDVVDNNKPKKAVVVGGGFIGLEMAEALIERGLDVSLVELEPQVFAPADPEMATPIHQHMSFHGVDLKLKLSITGIEEKNDSLVANLSDGSGIACDLIVLAIGVKPETKLAVDAGLKIGERRGILVDDHMRTSDPNIYAVGDAIEVEDFVGGFKTVIPLAGPANRQGRIAADNIFGKDSTYKKTQGTSVCKIFDLTAATTGLNEKMLKRFKMSYEKIYIHPASHAGYYPGATPMSLKFIFDPETGKVLGAQAVGVSGVDKRIDVIAVAIRAGLTVHQMRDLELCYAPPFGSAKDPVNYAAFVASNIMDGDMAICHIEEALNPKENQLILDVRTKDEVEVGTIPGAINIPIDELRDRIDEIPKNKELLVTCQVGLRGYIACRILNQRGYKCRNISGGYKTYKAVIGEFSETPDAAREIKEDTGVDNIEKKVKTDPTKIVKSVDACGLQCPGPILKLKEALDTVALGETISIETTDQGFTADVAGWCKSTCNILHNVERVGASKFRAIVSKGSKGSACNSLRTRSDKKTMVVFSGDFDKAMAAFIIANGAAATGSDVTMFFTFWGINLLRKANAPKVKKNLIEKMFGMMMPRGANKAHLSNMHMGGMGLGMIKGIMKSKNVSPIDELIANAQKNGVKMIVCNMSMDLMGIKKEELIDGIDEGGVALYISEAEESGVNLFI